VICRYLRRAKKHLGRRGRFLLIVGIGEMAWGAGMIYDPPSTAGLSLLTDRCPLSTWAWMWILPGLTAVGASFLTVGRDKAGFIAAYIPPTVWALAYAAAAVSGAYSRGSFVAVWYLTIVGVIMWAASVPEYSVPPAPLRPRKGKGS
jgi:hypothetical protein